MRLDRKRVGTGAAAMASAGALAAAVVVGAGHGNPAREVTLLSGAAWLASAQVGQVTLLDGSSAEVAAQVKVADPGASVDVVQQGSTAYAVNHTAGTITRVDGATFEHGKPATPIPDAHDGLTAFAGNGPLYALDTQRGLLVAADARTLAPQGRAQSLSALLIAGSATMDSAGHLWLIDQATGDLTRVVGAEQTTHRATTKPGNSVLTMAGDNPVVVDITDRKAIRISPDAVMPDTVIDLDLSPSDKVQASGSPHGQRLYVVSSRGVLVICDLAAAKCGATIPIAAPATTFGQAVEAGNRVFIPDYTGGRVWIVDLATQVVVAKPQVLPPGQFQLLTRDGVVFFNDPNTEKAGVVRIDGGVRNAAKYDPADPNKGLNAPPDTKTPNASPTQNQTPPSSTPNQPTDTQLPTSATGPNQSTVPTVPTVPTNPTVPTQPPTTTTPPPVKPKPKLGIKVSKADPTVGEPVTLEVTNSTGGLASASWDFGDGKSATGLSVQHKWDAAKTYQVSVRATTTDGQSASTGLSVKVGVPQVELKVMVSGGGSMTGGPINCPPTCTAKVDKDSKVVLTAHESTQDEFSYFMPGCSTTGGTATEPTCTVNMFADQVTGAGFTPMPKLTITINQYPGTDNHVTGDGVACPPSCTVYFHSTPAKTVTLELVPDSQSYTNPWEEGCDSIIPGTYPDTDKCVVTMTSDKHVKATFGLT
ncbi:PKD domain-containing protein [Labedaea rhizosphaerae]|uniref:PKD domain-containing protein n=1 Tax=Labedaea rhizosphaerae TaxID=598644 RepID=A0A4R6SHC2_LABRH|nr:PKD domain-containing protein [Labedaea rhizosphaerae]TDQ00756.1 PKD domain-containing protein [Labedaea rhizosphaerae]